jgi:hypothetical protein
LGSTLAEPSAERGNGLLSAVKVAKPKGIHDASLRPIDAERASGTCVERSAVDRDGRRIKAMPSNQHRGSRLTLMPWKGDVHDRWDVVDKSVSSERGDETEGRVRRSDSDLQEVVLHVAAGPEVDTAAQRFESAHVAPCVELPVRDPARPSVTMRKHWRKALKNDCRHEESVVRVGSCGYVFTLTCWCWANLKLWIRFIVQQPLYPDEAVPRWSLDVVSDFFLSFHFVRRCS